MLLGFRRDVAELYNVADIFVFPSLQEGLPVSVMEAMAMGLPVVASKIRGNEDLVDEDKGGYLVPANDIDAYANAIDNLLDTESQKMESIIKRKSQNLKLII